jgi:hypothetical protein
MKPNDRPKPTLRYAYKDLADEILFYDAKNDRVHILNATARAIYLRCDGTRSVEEIARDLVAEFDTDLETATTDLRTVLGQLIGLGVLTLNGGEPPASPQP